MLLSISKSVCEVLSQRWHCSYESTVKRGWNSRNFSWQEIFWRIVFIIIMIGMTKWMLFLLYTGNIVLILIIQCYRARVDYYKEKFTQKRSIRIIAGFMFSWWRIVCTFVVTGRFSDALPFNVLLNCGFMKCQNIYALTRYRKRII